MSMETHTQKVIAAVAPSTMVTAAATGTAKVEIVIGRRGRLRDTLEKISISYITFLHFILYICGMRCDVWCSVMWCGGVLLCGGVVWCGVVCCDFFIHYRSHNPRLIAFSLPGTSTTTTLLLYACLSSH